MRNIELENPIKGQSPVDEGRQKEIVRNTLGAISGKAPNHIEIDTVRYDEKGKIIKGSGEFYNEVEEIKVNWPDDKVFQVEQAVRKEVNGEEKVHKTAEPTWLQIAKKIGQTGEYPESVGVSKKRAFVSGGKLETHFVQGEVPFSDFKGYIVTNLKRTYSEYNGGRRVNLIEVGKELTAREVTQQGGRTGRIPETVFRAK